MAKKMLMLFNESIDEFKRGEWVLFHNPQDFNKYQNVARTIKYVKSEDEIDPLLVYTEVPSIPVMTVDDNISDYEISIGNKEEEEVAVVEPEVSSNVMAEVIATILGDDVEVSQDTPETGIPIFADDGVIETAGTLVIADPHNTIPPFIDKDKLPTLKENIEKLKRQLTDNNEE